MELRGLSVKYMLRGVARVNATMGRANDVLMIKKFQKYDYSVAATNM